MWIYPQAMMERTPSRLKVETGLNRFQCWHIIQAVMERTPSRLKVEVGLNGFQCWHIILGLVSSFPQVVLKKANKGGGQTTDVV
jgi:hypothetical protein